MAIVAGAKAIEAWLMKPRTKAPKNEQNHRDSHRRLAAYASEGLLQNPLSERTQYRYKGVLLAYQKALQGAFPTLQTSVQFLLGMRARQVQ